VTPVSLVKIVVSGRMLLLAVSVIVDAYPLPEILETSYPVGAVTVILELTPVPFTVKEVVPDAVPEQVANPVKDATDVVSEAPAYATTAIREAALQVVLLNFALRLA